MPVAIAGMHRSGTSMVTRLLNLCGLDLGPAEQLMEPAPDNPEGFWESMPFVHINEELLHSLNGAWDRPPEGMQDWAAAPELAAYRERAAHLIGELGLKEPWGWKDPRNSPVAAAISVRQTHPATSGRFQYQHQMGIG